MQVHTNCVNGKTGSILEKEKLKQQVIMVGRVANTDDDKQVQRCQ